MARSRCIYCVAALFAVFVTLSLAENVCSDGDCTAEEDFDGSALIQRAAIVDGKAAEAPKAEEQVEASADKPEAPVVLEEDKIEKTESADQEGIKVEEEKKEEAAEDGESADQEDVKVEEEKTEEDTTSEDTTEDGEDEEEDEVEDEEEAEEDEEDEGEEEQEEQDGEGEEEDEEVQLVHEQKEEAWRALTTDCKHCVHKVWHAYFNTILPAFHKCLKGCKDDKCKLACKTTSQARATTEFSTTCAKQCSAVHKSFLLTDVAPTEDEVLDEVEGHVVSFLEDLNEEDGLDMVEYPEPEAEDVKLTEVKEEGAAQQKESEHDPTDSAVFLQSAGLNLEKAVPHAAAQDVKKEEKAWWWYNAKCKACMKKHWQAVKAELQPKHAACKAGCKGDAACVAKCDAHTKGEARKVFKSKCATDCSHLLLSDVSLADIPEGEHLEGEEAEGAAFLAELETQASGSEENVAEEAEQAEDASEDSEDEQAEDASEDSEDEQAEDASEDSEEDDDESEDDDDEEDEEEDKDGEEDEEEDKEVTDTDNNGAEEAEASEAEDEDKEETDTDNNGAEEAEASEDDEEEDEDKEGEDEDGEGEDAETEELAKDQDAQEADEGLAR